MRLSKSIHPLPISFLVRLRLPATSSGWGWFIFCFALTLRCVYALLASYVDPFLVRDPLLGDAASYDRLTRTLLTTGEYAEFAGSPSTFWPPLYPMVLAAIYGVFGHQLLIARLFGAVLGALLPLFAFLAIERLQHPRIARWVALGLVIYPYLLYFGAWLIAESLFFALFGAVLWVGARMQQRPSIRLATVMGVVLGLTTLAKPTLLMQLPLFAIWFLWCLPGSLLQRFKLGVLTALITCAVIAPWTLRNYTLLGAFVPVSTNGGYTFYGANNPNAFGGHYENFPPRLVGLNEAQEQSEYYRMGLSWIQANPDRFTWLVGQKLIRLISPLSVASSPEDFQVPGELLIRIGYSLYLLTAFTGLLLSFRQWRRYVLFYIPIVGVLISTVLFYGDARYLLPAVPSLLLFSALAIGWLWEHRP